MDFLWNGFHVLQVLMVLLTGAAGTELVPERYLRPRDFNHHPFTDVGVPASLKTAPRLPSTHPYAILATKRPREGRQFPQQDVIIYPSPHPSVLPRKHQEPLDNTVETNEIGYDSDPYVNVPKNYAFSYSVKDQQSGDDFSHSQAHNGKATRGQYRVKLPDGRVQVVSYTADHKGYRADVQYEEDTTAVKPLFEPVQQIVPETPAALPRHSPNTLYDSYESQQKTSEVAPVQFPQTPADDSSAAEPELAPAYPSQSPAYPSQSPAYPSQSPPYHARHNYQYIPRYVDSDYLQHSTAAPEEEYSHNTVTPSPGPLRIVLAQAGPDDHFIRQKYVSTTAAPYPEQHYVSSTPGYISTAEPYHQQYESTTAGGHYGEDHDGYLSEGSSVAAPAQAQVLVTPRTLFKPHKQRQPLLIHYVKK